jgi:uncharacterized protein (DUF1015 family)
VPHFEPFSALRYTNAQTDLFALSSPPYDVLSADDRAHYGEQSPWNIVHVDCPLDADGPDRYQKASTDIQDWISSKVLTLDPTPSYTLYRMSFRDSTGKDRHTVGVIGALEVVDVGAGGVLPHEQTTPKAKTDRLDLTRATQCNLSPVWGLSLCSGLTQVLIAPGEFMGEMTDEDGVVHRVERVTDASRIEAIRSAIASAPVVIADGHHRYAISRTYRDEMRATNSPLAPAAGLTMTYVAELVEEQLSIAAIHRLVAAVSPSQMESILEGFYTRISDSTLSEHTLTQMNTEKAICLLRPDGSTTLYCEKVEKFSEVRALDSARLEHAITTALGSLDAAEISYQHGTHEVLDALKAGQAQCAVLIRPVSLAEIRRTADEGLLMPPKSTFFTPKLRTGLAMRPLTAG